MAEQRYRLETLGGEPPRWAPLSIYSTDDLEVAKETADYCKNSGWHGARVIDGQTGAIVYSVEGPWH